jgi:hypothetical protein
LTILTIDHPCGLGQRGLAPQLSRVSRLSSFTGFRLKPYKRLEAIVLVPVVAMPPTATIRLYLRIQTF